MQATMLERENRPRANRALAAGLRNDVPGGAILGRIGPLEVRLARDPLEVAAAQEVRFRVFYDELGARRHEIHEVEKRDADRFDAVCDHLLVLDTALGGSAGSWLNAGSRGALAFGKVPMSRGAGVDGVCGVKLATSRKNG